MSEKLHMKSKNRILGIWRAMLFSLFALLPLESYAEMEVAAQRTEQYLPLLSGKRVGLVVNQTSMVGNTHLVDFLIEQSIRPSVIFAPEHGFRGDKDAGAVIKHGIDQKSGVKVFSIYGKHKKPSADTIKTLDIILFDIQDVGLRYYTYISSMHYMMEAAAENNVDFLVLDRPNPNGRFVDGPILDPEFQSFVGMHPIPVLHGMTVAELARMIKGEEWIRQAKQLKLHTVKIADYRREMHYDLPIPPSPNLPNSASIRLYPVLCFFEATPVSVGRGTPFPFQLAGHDTVPLGNFAFTPISTPGAALKPKLMNHPLQGIDLRESTVDGLDLTLFYQVYLQFHQQGMTFFTRADFFDKLAGTDKLRKQFQSKVPLEDIVQGWQSDLEAFRKRREPYLLYPDF